MISAAGRFFDLCTKGAQESATQNFEQGIEIAGNVVTGGLKRSDPAASMEHRRVVTASECLANVGQAELGELFRERHGDLTRSGDVAAAFLGIHFGHFDLVIIGDRLLDIIDRHLAALQREQIL